MRFMECGGLASGAMRLFVMALALFPAGACSETPAPIPLGSDTYYYGYIDSGTKFGVEIGEDRQHAKATLEKRKFFYGGEGGCDRYMKRLIECAPEHRSDIYRVTETLMLRDGFVFLEFKEEKLTAIIWNFQALRRPDF